MKGSIPLAWPVFRPRRFAPLRALGWAAILALSAYFMVSVALPYFSVNPDSYGRFWPRAPWLLAHVIGGSLALLLGPLQFWSSARVRFQRLHRWSGRLYLGGVLVAGASALYLSFYTRLLGFAVGLFTLGVLWLVSSALAYAAIRNGQVKSHREWMIRSYMFTLAFVSFRVLVLIAFALELGEPREIVPILGWLCWTVPMFGTEVALRWRETVRPARGRAAPVPGREPREHPAPAPAA